MPSEFLRCPHTLPRRASTAKQACLPSSPGDGGGCLRHTRKPATHPWGWQPHGPSAGGRFCARTSKIGPRAAASQTHKGVRLSRMEAGSFPKQGGAAGSSVLRRGTDGMHTRKTGRSAEPPAETHGAPTPGDGRRAEESGGLLHPEAWTHLLGWSPRPDGSSAWRGGWLGVPALGRAHAAAAGRRRRDGRGSQEFRGVGRSMTMGGFTGW